MQAHTRTHTLLCAHPYSVSANYHRQRKKRGRRREKYDGRGSVSAYTEECLPQMREGRVQLNTCPVTQTCATGCCPIFEIGRHRHRQCLACSSSDQCKVTIQNIQMPVFHIWHLRSVVTFSRVTLPSRDSFAMSEDTTYD